MDNRVADNDQSISDGADAGPFIQPYPAVCCMTNDSLRVSGLPSTSIPALTFSPSSSLTCALSYSQIWSWPYSFYPYFRNSIWIVLLLFCKCFLESSFENLFWIVAVWSYYFYFFCCNNCCWYFLCLLQFASQQKVNIRRGRRGAPHPALPCGLLHD